MFDLEKFVDECRTAVKADPTHRTTHEIVKRAFDDIPALIDAIGEPTKGGLTPIFKSDDLTILNVVWARGMTLMPHNHETWAIIGIYGGQEDNTFWRRLKDDPDGRIESAGNKSLVKGDVVPLGRDIIHSVTNPLTQLTGAIHVYGADFFEIERSEWHANKLTERPYDISKARALFDAHGK